MFNIRHLTTSSLLASSLSWLLIAGCSSSDITSGEDAELATLTSMLRKGEPGATNGSLDYCDGLVKCTSGEGDCDNNAQCDVGLVCGAKIGSRFGLYYSLDVCWPSHCENGIKDSDETQVDAGGSCGCVLNPYYYDPDRDGYGTNNTSYGLTWACSPPAGWAAVRGDCNDSDATINPAAAEICDKKDNNCNGQIDETAQAYYQDSDRDGRGTNNTSIAVIYACSQPVGWSAVRGDCNDSDATIYTGATEVCDKKDNNCNGQIDETAQPYYYDPDRDGYGTNNTSIGVTWACTQPVGWAPTRGDCLDSDATVNPLAFEVCDGKDNNCNGTVDEGKPTWCQDADLDGWPRNASCVSQCAKPSYNYAQQRSSFDCNDTNKNVYPGRTEIKNNIDDDCDGIVDNTGFPATCSNGVMDAGETGVDCGGSCDVCGTVAAGPSCTGLAQNCGSSQSCCSVATVYGGSFIRSYDNTAEYSSQAAPATVNSFRLDTYEVTVGRFRKFLAAYDAWRAASNPVAGAGAHPLIAGTGWNAGWTLPASAAAFATNLKCDATQQTWTDTAGVSEVRPINCVNFFEAAAFCAWDGGRLPTEAEWNYAAAGGSQQRAMPWSYPTTTDTAVELTKSSFGCVWDGTTGCTLRDIETEGALSAGTGRWGHASMAGGVWEWTLDWYAASYITPCVNCAQTTASVGRVIRGGSYQSWPTSNLRTSFRNRANAGNRSVSIGVRCAR